MSARLVGTPLGSPTEVVDLVSPIPRASPGSDHPVTPARGAVTMSGAAPPGSATMGSTSRAIPVSDAGPPDGVANGTSTGRAASSVPRRSDSGGEVPPDLAARSVRQRTEPGEQAPQSAIYVESSDTDVVVTGSKHRPGIANPPIAET